MLHQHYMNRNSPCGFNHQPQLTLGKINQFNVTHGTAWASFAVNKSTSQRQQSNQLTTYSHFGCTCQKSKGVNVLTSF